MAIKARKFRLYPNAAQRLLIEKTFGCCRFIYNQGLELRNAAYKEGKTAGYSETSARLTELKTIEDYKWLQEPDSIALQQSLRDLDAAFTRFFEKKANYPQFKSKHGSDASYRTLNQNNCIRIDGSKIKLPKLGWVKFKQTDEVGDIRNVTVSRSPAGEYYISVAFFFQPQPLPATDSAIGIDVGIKEFSVDSNGSHHENPKYLTKSLQKLKREQRRLSRKKTGSKNREKQRVRVAKVHERVANQRRDHHQKLSTKLIRENQVICVEDLNIKGMMKNHNLAQAIGDAAWGEFMRELEYKAEWYGRTIVKVPTFYPSSQTCSCCGYKNADVKNLRVRLWTCPECGASHDRDKNAADNILEKGIAILIG